MNSAVVITFALIVLARIGDVSLDAVRTVAIVQGRRLFAGVLGFVQALVYVCVIAKVLENAQQPVFMLAYALGFALGTWFGVVVEQRMAFGLQMVSVFTRRGAEVAKALVKAGYRVAHVLGYLGDGEVAILYVEVARKRAPALLLVAATVDELCFCIVNDVRAAGLAATQTPRRPGRVRHAARPGSVSGPVRSAT